MFFGVTGGYRSCRTKSCLAKLSTSWFMHYGLPVEADWGDDANGREGESSRR